MSNHARHHLRRGRPRSPRLLGIAWMDFPEAQRLLDECDCPAVIVPGEVTYIEHMHRHACPALKRWAS